MTAPIKSNAEIPYRLPYPTPPKSIADWAEKVAFDAITLSLRGMRKREARAILERGFDDPEISIRFGYLYRAIENCSIDAAITKLWLIYREYGGDICSPKRWRAFNLMLALRWVRRHKHFNLIARAVMTRPTGTRRGKLTEIRKLKARVTRLEKALRPFANEAAQWADTVSDRYRPGLSEPRSNFVNHGAKAAFTIGCCRRAMRLLTPAGRSALTEAGHD